MEKIILSNDQVFELAVNGARSTDDSLTISFLPKYLNLSDLKDVFINPDNTHEISLIDVTGKKQKIFLDYTVLTDIGVQLNSFGVQDLLIDGEVPVMEDVVTVVLKREDKVSRVLQNEEKSNKRLNEMDEKLNAILQAVASESAVNVE